ncbi:hypothetical protein GCAAIG_05565 [Candidatus Electronema halotolerans]
MQQENDDKLDKNFLIALIGLIISFIIGGLALLFTVATPEMRDFFGLNDQKQKIEQPVEEAKHLPGPFSATLHENQTQFIEEAETRISITFNEEYKIVTLTIAPDGKQTANRAVENGYTEEFTSSTGSFLVHIMNIDWSGKAVKVQMSRKSSIKSAEKL